MIFSNYDKIATSPARKEILSIANEAIEKVEANFFFPRIIKYVNGNLFVKENKFPVRGKRIFVVGLGKASAEMALELEKILGAKQITDGVVISNYAKKIPKKIKIHLADHPIPSERGLAGIQKIFNLKEKYKINENDLVIALVSGGGSALAPFPVEGVSLHAKRKIYDLFIKHAVTGRESTIIKTKISRVKGGGLARHFYPANILSLIVSDDNGVAGDEFTASGPFISHSSDFKDAIKVIDKYKLRKKVPGRIVSYLEKNANKVEKNNKFSHVQQFVLSSNKNLVEEIVRAGKKRNITVVMKSNVEGEAKKVAHSFCAEIKKNKFPRPTLLLYGGETTVTLPSKHGLGGRNQEFVVACLKYLKKINISRSWSLVSIATDGVDYIKESAGGIICSHSLKLVRDKKIDLGYYLKKHDSFNLLNSINSNIVTYPTGTNVGDIMMFYIK